MTKRELEEINEQLQELVRELRDENAHLTLSWKLAHAQIERLTERHERLRTRCEALTDYVKSLRNWAGQFAQTVQAAQILPGTRMVGSGNESGSERWLPG